MRRQVSVKRPNSRTHLKLLQQLLPLFHTLQILIVTGSEFDRLHFCQLAAVAHAASPLDRREVLEAMRLWSYRLTKFNKLVPLLNFINANVQNTLWFCFTYRGCEKSLFSSKISREERKKLSEHAI